MARKDGARRGEPVSRRPGKFWFECLIVLAIFFIPSGIFYLYVGAFQQPTVNMVNTPVLVVNLDNGTAGQAVEDAIFATGVYKFQRANYSYAANAVSDGEEWAAIVIPPGFSQRIDDGGDAQIVLLADDSTSYIVTRVLTPTIQTIVGGLDVGVKLNAINRTAEAEGQIAMQEEADAERMSMLSNASAQLGAGSGEISESLGSGAEGLSYVGSSEYGLASAVEEGASGAGALGQGLMSLYNGSESVANGTESLGSGTSQLVGLNGQLNGVIAQALAEAEASNSPALVESLKEAEALSSAEYSGLSRANSSVASIAKGARSLSSGLRTAADSTSTLADSLGEASDAVMYSASATEGASSSLLLASGSTAQVSSGAAAVSGSLGLVSDEESQLSSASSQVSAAAGSLPGISLVVEEENKADYGTFFATAFVILGLFLGGASAFLYSALSKLKRPLPFAMLLVLVQSVVLAAVYQGMGFPMREGEAAFVLVLFLSGAAFVLLTRLITTVISPNIAHEHLIYLTPTLSLLAVFMISSGGAIWPGYTLQPPFSALTPYIPFNYAVAGVRATALRGAFPAYDIAVLLAFCAAFAAATAAIGLLRRMRKGGKR